MKVAANFCKYIIHIYLTESEHIFFLAAVVLNLALIHLHHHHVNVFSKAAFFSFYIGYVQAIYETFLDAQRKDTLKEEAKKIKKMTPKPMNTMLNKQSRDEAVKKRKERRAMVLKDVPPTSTGLKNQCLFPHFKLLHFYFHI